MPPWRAGPGAGMQCLELRKADPKRVEKDGCFENSEPPCWGFQDGEKRTHHPPAVFVAGGGMGPRDGRRAIEFTSHLS